MVIISISTMLCSAVAKQRVQLSRAFSTKATDIPPPPPGRGPLARWANFDVTQQKPARLNTLKWILDKFGYHNEENALFFQSGAIFHSCVNQVAEPEFFRALQLTPDFRSQQALLMIHIWMIHRRLMKGGTHGKIMQEQVFDRLWEDTTLRLRNQEVSELTVNKYLKEVQQMCFSACVAYDRGLENGKMGLISPITKHLLNIEGNAKKMEAEAMSKYVVKNLKTLETTPFRAFETGAIPWERRLSKKDPVPPNVAQLEDKIIGRQYGEWRSALDSRGQVFYWNRRTRLSAWELPTN